MSSSFCMSTRWQKRGWNESSLEIHYVIIMCRLFLRNLGFQVYR